MIGNEQDQILALLSPEAVRHRCHELLDAAKAAELNHFTLHFEQLEAVTELVLTEIRTNYPNGKVPFHSRWRHFEFGTRDLWAELAAALPVVTFGEDARRQFDLAIISVLLDAGAGLDWQYTDKKTSLTFGRSEGLALASLRFLESGILSRYGLDDPIRADAGPLERLGVEALADMFQVSAHNPLVGVTERTSLLNRLGTALKLTPDMFCKNGRFRLGHLYDYLLTKAKGNVLPAREILMALLRGINTIWPEGERIADIPVGDVGQHSKIIRTDSTNGILPFHKLSQWMAYSLIEPLQNAGIKITDLDALTGLAEYRNGGLFIDAGVLTLKDVQAAAKMHHPKSELVVEWRGLTVALLDYVAAGVRLQTKDDANSLPLASVLQGGTWSAGRKIATSHRADGSPPIRLNSSGTIF